MDLFKYDNDDIYTSTNTRSVVIWVEQLGRKRVTHVSGWDISDDQATFHLKTFKKKHGCNGNLKKNMEEPGYEFQFQGNHIDAIKQYLITHKVEPNSIYVKG